MHYLIDGHNLIGKMPDIQLSDPNDEVKMVLRLQEWLNGRSSQQATVIFDGRRMMGGVSNPLSSRQLTVIFSPDGIIADDLLDVHVPNQDQDLGLLDDLTEDLQSNGIKNFTPQRMDNEPIPEIGNRLDEFFSLDDSSDNMVITDEKTNLTAEVSPIANDGPADGIVPFQHKDESFEESLHKSDDNEPLPQYPDSDILSRLKSSIETSEWLRDGSSILSINQDISFLEKRWQNDPEKICLLQIISSLTNVLKSRPETIQQENENKIKEADKSVSDTSRKKTGGIWKKIKKTFTS